MQLKWPQTFIPYSTFNNDQIIQHHLEGLCFATQHDKKWQMRWKQQWIHNELKCEVLRDLAIILSRNNIHPVLLKGVDLLFRIYQDKGSRFLSDIDLYIEKQELKKFTSLLIHQGFQLLKEKIWMGNCNKRLFHKIVKGEEIVIEVHTSLFYHTEEVIYSTQDSPIRGYKQLDLETLFVHLAGHLAFQHNYLKLYWLFDLFYLHELYNKAMDWDKVLQLAKRLQLQRSIQQVIWILHHFFDCSFPWNISTHAIDRVLITKELLCDEKQTGPEYFLLKHFTKDSLLLSLKYDFLWFKNKIS